MSSIKHYILSSILCIILFVATRIVIDIGETVAYVLCAVASGISAAWYLYYYPEAPESAHFLAISVITLYQSHFVIEHLHAEWWLEWFMCGVAASVYLADFYVWYLVSSGDRTTAPEDARRFHGMISNIILIAMGYIPLHGAGLFKIKDDFMLLGLVVLQWGLGITETQRNIRTHQFSTPHPAIKCLPLLYLPPPLWPIFGVFLVVNILVIYREKQDLGPKNNLA